MSGYVRRVNEATFKVTIGGIRIGSAKYSRLAQINLKSRIITFSRFAIENVPERGRRYLVIHELAHVKEPSHNKRFWQLVEQYEPDYRQVSRSLQLAFKQNVKQEAGKANRQVASRERSLPVPTLLLNAGDNPFSLRTGNQEGIDISFDADTVGDGADSFDCLEDEFGAWDTHQLGTICGGSEIP